MDNLERELLGFEDPTKIGDAPATPSIFRTMMGVFLLVFIASLGATIWDAKWGKEEGSISSYIFKKGEETANSRWQWEPYRLEYQLYYDRGYNLRWLETKNMQKCRETFGSMFCFFEIIILRLWGALNYFVPMMICFMFAVSLGSVRYYDKRFQFKHISSTFNNASIKVLFWAIPFTVLWAMVPFGVNVPVLGQVPILVQAPVIGVVWISSPGFGALIFGALYCLVGFTLGSNFSREI